MSDGHLLFFYQSTRDVFGSWFIHIKRQMSFYGRHCLPGTACQQRCRSHSKFSGVCYISRTFLLSSLVYNRFGLWLLQLKSSMTAFISNFEIEMLLHLLIQLHKIVTFSLFFLFWSPFWVHILPSLLVDPNDWCLLRFRRNLSSGYQYGREISFNHISCVLNCNDVRSNVQGPLIYVFPINLTQTFWLDSIWESQDSSILAVKFAIQKFHENNYPCTNVKKQIDIVRDLNNCMRIAWIIFTYIQYSSSLWCTRPRASHRKNVTSNHALY